MYHWNVVIMVFIVAWGAPKAMGNNPSSHPSLLFRDSAQVNIDHHRYLISGYGKEDTSEDRGIYDVVEKAKATLMSSEISATTINRWMTHGKAADKAFLRFHLDQAGDKLFDNPQFVKWVQYVDALNANNPKRASTTIPTLTAGYGDEALLKMLETAQNNPRTNSLATKLLGEQMEYWATIGKSPDDVFTLFKINTAGQKLLENPQVSKWIQYVDDLSVKHPEKGISTMPTLTAVYGDEGLLKMLETAQKVPSTKDVATKLLAEQVQHWATTGTSPGSVFIYFQMDAAGSKVFESSRWNNWVNYVKIYNKMNPKTQTSVIGSLENIYGDNYLVSLLDAAGKVPVSKKMELELIQLWLKKDKSTDDVFKLLDLDKVADKVLENPQLAFWGKYASYYNKKNPDAMATLIATLTTHFGDEGVRKMLETAKQVPFTKLVATRLETEQLQHWLSIDHSPAKVFALFKLDEAGENLLSNSQFLIWRKYTDEYGLKNPKATVNTIRVLRRYYEDDVLANLIITGMKSSSTQPSAARLQSELFKSWMPTPPLTDIPQPPDAVFHILKLDEMGEKAFTSPMFSFWKIYMDHYNNVILQPDPQKRATLISVLKANYEDEAVVNLLEAVEKIRGRENLLET
ncbi:RxLR effector protein [Phytophthora megakarya]|uniref:RxLR effector protein n=1 Tax=Phytophthora megakarya TaxID=4795 RepID=A0A225X4B5_9STRA|nr:RxLR effector protein [Phytophthora megakarya]